MKAIYTLFAVAVVGLVGCKDDNKGLLDPNAMISLRPAAGVPSGKANTEHLTAAQIVRQAKQVTFWNVTLAPENAMDRGIADHQRDFENNRLLMYGTDVITTRGELAVGIIECTDFLFLTLDGNNRPIDTVAYIPNSVMRKAEQAIKAAFADGDYATCYQILDREFVFTPITGEEWRALKAKNEN